LPVYLRAPPRGVPWALLYNNKYYTTMAKHGKKREELNSNEKLCF